MPQLPVDPDQRPPYRRRALLRIGQDEGWWDYESENPPGYVAGAVTYDETTYTIRLPDRRRLTLTGGEVDQLLTLDDAAGVRAQVARIAEFSTE